MDIILDVSTRNELRQWYMENAVSGEAFLLHVSRKRAGDDGVIHYIDAVEEALCFGYIDSTNRKIDGVTYNRFSPRRKKSHWTELNLARCRRLERLGLMTDLGRAVVPNVSEVVGEWIVECFSNNTQAYEAFLRMPRLYQRVKLSNIHFTESILKDHVKAVQQLQRLIEASQAGKMIGEWNDGGRLSDLDC